MTNNANAKYLIYNLNRRNQRVNYKKYTSLIPHPLLKKTNKVTVSDILRLDGNKVKKAPTMCIYFIE